MLQSVNNLHGFVIHALDGELGRIEDLYFDDRHWTVRYLVVDTGKWLAGRRVLISPACVTGIDWPSRRISVTLTSDQVKNSPDVSTERTVSRQHEEELSAYYGWPSYWATGAFGFEPAPLSPPVAMIEPPAVKGDPHLRSAREVKGYHIGARNGSIGHVSDFVFDDATWEIAFMIVDAGSWLHERLVLLRPDWVAGIAWGERTVDVKLLRETVETSPPFTPEFPIPAEYAERLVKHYDGNV